MPRKRRQTSGRFCVADRSFPNVGSAVSYAQGLACRWAIEHGEERSFYVRDALDVGLYRVDIVDGVVYTTEVKTAA